MWMAPNGSPPSLNTKPSVLRSKSLTRLQKISKCTPKEVFQRELYRDIRSQVTEEEKTERGSVLKNNAEEIRGRCGNVTTLLKDFDETRELDHRLEESVVFALRDTEMGHIFENAEAADGPDAKRITYYLNTTENYETVMIDDSDDSDEDEPPPLFRFADDDSDSDEHEEHVLRQSYHPIRYCSQIMGTIREQCQIGRRKIGEVYRANPPEEEQRELRRAVRRGNRYLHQVQGHLDKAYKDLLNTNEALKKFEEDSNTQLKELEAACAKEEEEYSVLLKEYDTLNAEDVVARETEELLAALEREEQTTVDTSLESYNVLKQREMVILGNIYTKLSGRVQDKLPLITKTEKWMSTNHKKLNKGSTASSKEVKQQLKAVTELDKLRKLFHESDHELMMNAIDTVNDDSTVRLMRTVLGDEHLNISSDAMLQTKLEAFLYSLYLFFQHFNELAVHYLYDNEKAADEIFLRSWLHMTSGYNTLQTTLTTQNSVYSSFLLQKQQQSDGHDDSKDRPESPTTVGGQQLTLDESFRFDSNINLLNQSVVSPTSSAFGSSNHKSKKRCLTLNELYPIFGNQTAITIDTVMQEDKTDDCVRLRKSITGHLAKLFAHIKRFKRSVGPPLPDTGSPASINSTPGPSRLPTAQGSTRPLNSSIRLKKGPSVGMDNKPQSPVTNNSSVTSYNPFPSPPDTSKHPLEDL